MPPTSLTGTLAAAVSPLDHGGTRVDEHGLVALLEYYATTGLDGVLLCGTTGEGVLLEAAERKRIAEVAVGVAGALKVVVHAGAQTTAQSVELAAHAAEMGADAVAVIAPPYFAFTARELLEHLVAAARACSPLPFYAYEYADRSGYALPVGILGELSELAPNLAGLKVSDSPFARARPYLDTGLDVFVGAEDVIAAGLGAGAVGAVSALAAAFPEEVAALVAEPTPERQAHVDRLKAALAQRPLSASLKVALDWRGLPITPDVRRPLLPLSDSERRDLAETLDAITAAAPAPG
jgi:N-acetylneuraminate lyase